MHSHQPERGKEMGMKKMNLKQNVNEMVISVQLTNIGCWRKQADGQLTKK